MKKSNICQWCEKPYRTKIVRDAANIRHEICAECWKDHLEDLGRIYVAMKRTELKESCK